MSSYFRVCGLLVGLMWGTVNAQHFDIKKISTNEGLPSGQIGDVVQDEEGFIWLSTYDGLIRYDGIETKAFTEEHGLRNNLIYDIFIDSQKRFWVSVEEEGVGELLSDTIVYHTDLSVLDSLTVTHINESADGRLWFSTYGAGVFIWDGDSVTQLSEKEGLPSNYGWNIFFRNNGESWIGTWNGIGIYDGEKFKVINEENGLSGQSAYTFSEDDNGAVWVSTSSGVSRFDGTKWSQLYKINGRDLNYVYDVHTDQNGLVWIATESDGIYWYDGQEYTHINKTNGLSSNYIYSLNEDNEGRVWVATDENGVNLFRNKGFRIYSDRDKIAGASVSDILEDGDDFWLATDEGITRFEENGNSSHYKLPEHLVSYKEVWNLEKLPNDNYLVQNSYSELLEFDGQSFTDYGNKIDIPWLAIQDYRIYEDKIWFATETALVKYENKQYTYYTTEEGLSDNFVWSLYEDSEGYLWAASDQGVNKVVGDSIISYSFEDGIGGNSMHLITESKPGHFWIGTDTGFSELVFDDEHKVIGSRSFTLRDEFLKETQFLQFDDQLNLWQGTSAGIHFYKRALLDSAKSGIIDGIFYPLTNYGKGLEMNFLASHQDKNGNLWFGSYTDGIVKYENKNTPKSSPAPKPFLRSIMANGTELKKENGAFPPLAYSRNNLEIQIGAFNYENPERVFYDYKLVGFQDNWSQLFGKQQVSYTNLPPGEYTFQLRTKSFQSDWGEPVALASIQIEKPFWNEVWFYILLVVVIVALIYSLFRYLWINYERNRLNQLVEEQTAELKSALNEKEVLIKEIHHRVKNNMAVVSGLLDLQSFKMTDVRAKSALENSKLRIQTMSSIHEKLYQNKDLSKVDFKVFSEDLVRNVANSLKGSGKDIHVELEIDEGDIDVNSAIPCGLILNEAVSNCYEHAFHKQEEGNVWVSFKSISDNCYQLIIKDDGAGMPEDIFDTKLNSLGLTLIKSLVTQVKGTLEVQNNQGTTIKIEFPK